VALTRGAVATAPVAPLSCGRELTFVLEALTGTRVAAGAGRGVLTAGTAFTTGGAIGRVALASRPAPRRVAAAGGTVNGRLLPGAAAAGAGITSSTGPATTGSAGLGCGDGTSTLTGGGGAAAGGSADGEGGGGAASADGGGEGGGGGADGRTGSRLSGST
jgi:hypothetical protein